MKTILPEDVSWVTEGPPIECQEKASRPMAKRSPFLYPLSLQRSFSRDTHCQGKRGKYTHWIIIEKETIEYKDVSKF